MTWRRKKIMPGRHERNKIMNEDKKRNKKVYKKAVLYKDTMNKILQEFRKQNKNT